MKKYDLIDTVSRGSNARKEINPQLIVETNGNYGPGQIFDANATIKLVQDGISSFIGDAPDAQIQSDWNQVDSTAKDFIKNKPTIPTVPTNVSAFTNDANYITNTDSIVDVKSAAMVELHNEITGLTNQLSNLGNVNATSINLEQFPKVNTYPMIIYGSGAPTDVPRFIGQLYVDTTTPSLYCAKAVTNSTGDWFNV